jgi:ribosomal protein S18 acetylase RimI-like enzyme
LTITIRDYRDGDAPTLACLVPAAYAHFQQHYADWPAMAAGLSKMPELAASGGEIVIAESADRIVGAVAYTPAHVAKPDYFAPQWPVIRMLAVDLDSRSSGAGRALTEECLRRARRDGAEAIALHTSPIMDIALAFYLRMGFEKLREIPPIHGVPYAVYVLRL